MEAAKEFKVKAISPGTVSGPALVIQERLSLKGSVDPESGLFRKEGSALDGASIAGKVLIFISGKGSSSWSGYFKMACRHKNVPLAIINLEIDPLAAAACVFNDIPLVQALNPGLLEEISTGDWVTVDSKKGVIRVQRQKL